MAECYNYSMAMVPYITKKLEIVHGGCWTWYRVNKVTGYATIGNELAHRKFYRLFKGKLIKGMTIDHLCRNRACVNPSHLEQVTHRENLLRSPINLATMNKYKTRCKNGHEFTSSNTIFRKDRPNTRTCKECRKLRNREYRARHSHTN